MHQRNQMNHVRIRRKNRSIRNRENIPMQEYIIHLLNKRFL